MKEKYNLKIKVRFVAEKKLNVGSAYPVKSKAELPFQRLGAHYYIAGSTIKGVLRTSLIKIANLLGYKGVSWSVEPTALSSAHNDIVVRLFGGPHDKESKVFVEPSYILHDTQVVRGIRIDDKTGIVEEGALFSIEYLPIGVEFETRIHGFDLDEEEARALFAAILEMNFERIGKSGVVSVKIVKGESEIPEELIEKDNVIKTILEAISI
ncbi:MAG: RAMP superfamily CRISPR-associated protein [Nitrososphaerota archaeon]